MSEVHSTDHLLIFSFIVYGLFLFSYLILRNAFSKDNLDRQDINKRLLLIMTVSSITLIFLISDLWLSEYNYYGSTISYSYMPTIFYLVDFSENAKYVWRIVSCILIVTSIILLILAYRKESLKNIIIFTIVGIIGHFLILLDFNFFPGRFLQNWINEITLHGVIVILVFVLSMIIYLMNLKELKNRQNKEE